MKYIIIFLIKAYRLTVKLFLKNIFGDFCRFSPSCSEYAILSIKKNGAVRGSIMAISRILKCHPYYKQNFQTNYE